MERAVVVSRLGMGDGVPELSLILLEKYLKSSLENDDVKIVYAFYNRGVQVLTDDRIQPLLVQLEAAGAQLYFCGTCLEYYGIAKQLNVGRVACINDIRHIMNAYRCDFL
ncbi:DsrE family protein [Persicirhabdus sediminis]|uniref:DsrE family protein n=1 Tax=Persicirhabdus sediminis TaxID=454144 RepID=A0A8J7MH94_9BACT|nr:DsrE family protein [Persicirhabdus sediminis]MBK1792841.1 DsrE family protein [Persicirhabdus sediminis]